LQSVTSTASEQQLADDEDVKKEQKRAKPVSDLKLSGGFETVNGGIMEQLCSDIIDLLRNEIDDVELVAELSQKITELFKAKNLLATEEA
jgi:hypothetical protein